MCWMDASSEKCSSEIDIMKLALQAKYGLKSLEMKKRVQIKQKGSRSNNSCGKIICAKLRFMAKLK